MRRLGITQEKLERARAEVNKFIATERELKILREGKKPKLKLKIEGEDLLIELFDNDYVNIKCTPNQLMEITNFIMNVNLVTARGVLSNYNSECCWLDNAKKLIKFYYDKLNEM